VAVPHAQPGEVIDVRPGKVLAEHKAPGEIIVHCIEGRIAFTALDQTHELTAGHLVSLPAGEPHSVQCLDDASFLLTILLRSSPAP
jgi:quercetin dioxygenase-like cupin family protein